MRDLAPEDTCSPAWEPWEAGRTSRFNAAHLVSLDVSPQWSLGNCRSWHKAAVQGHQALDGLQASTPTLALTLNNLRKRNNS